MTSPPVLYPRQRRRLVTGQVLTIDGGLTTIAGPSPMAIGEYEQPRSLLGPTADVS